jgi:hypothetical protein
MCCSIGRYVNRSFGGIHCLHLQGCRLRQGCKITVGCVAIRYHIPEYSIPQIHIILSLYFNYPVKIANRIIALSVSRLATGWTAGVRLRAGTRNFLFFTAFMPALGPTQPPIQRIPVALSSGLSGRDVKLTIHFHLVPKSRMVELYIHSPICVHGILEITCTYYFN